MLHFVPLTVRRVPIVIHAVNYLNATFCNIISLSEHLYSHIGRLRLTKCLKEVRLNFVKVFFFFCKYVSLLALGYELTIKNFLFLSVFFLVTHTAVFSPNNHHDHEEVLADVLLGNCVSIFAVYVNRYR